jgi:hypothetical protein
MDFGLAAYFMFVAVVGFVLHSLSRRFFVVSLGGAVLCSVVALWYSAWVANYEVKVGWVPVLLVCMAVYALPVTLAVGLPLIMLRRSRQRMCKPDKTGVMDEP